MKLLKLGLVAAGIALAGSGTIVIGAMRWEAATRAMRQQLEAGRLPPAATVVDFKALDGLPAPVQRYFRTVLREGQQPIAAADMRHTGLFKAGEEGGSWAGFSSKQRVVVRRPGFDWEARIAMFPGVPVLVRDAYVAGKGILHAAAWGLFPVAHAEGGAAIAEGELMRFLAEAAWYPTALLPSQGVHWEPIDEHSALARFEDGSVQISLTFTFAADGTISSVHAAARGRTVKGRTIPTPWTGRYWGYERHDGMLVPSEGEVGWELPEGERPYWRGRIEQIDYEFAH